MGVSENVSGESIKGKLLLLRQGDISALHIHGPKRASGKGGDLIDGHTLSKPHQPGFKAISDRGVDLLVSFARKGESAPYARERGDDLTCRCEAWDQVVITGVGGSFGLCLSIEPNLGIIARDRFKTSSAKNFNGSSSSKRQETERDCIRIVIFEAFPGDFQELLDIEMSDIPVLVIQSLFELFISLLCFLIV